MISPAGTKSEVATSPRPSRGPKRGRNCYVTRAFSGVPNAKHGNKIRRSGYLTPAFSGAQNKAELLCNPCILGGPQRQAREQNQKKWLPHPGLLGGRKEGGVLGGPQRQARGKNSEVATSPRQSRGLKRGRNCYETPEFSGFPNQNQKWVPNPYILGGPQRQARGQNQKKWLPHPSILGGLKEGGIAM